MKEKNISIKENKKSKDLLFILIEIWYINIPEKNSLAHSEKRESYKLNLSTSNKKMIIGE